MPSIGRPRAGSRLSFRKSSSSPIPKFDAIETPEEKARFQLHTKADPSKAINEAQPSDVAVAKSTISTSIRELQHRDQEGNVIADPDLSNPTRPRLERPLDTIRSFEAAIDGSYSRRQSYRPASQGAVMAQSRRSSSFFTGQPSMRRNPSTQYDTMGYGGSQSRPESYYDTGVTPGVPYYGHGNGNGNGNGVRRFGPRTQSDPALYGSNQQRSLTPSYGQHTSMETGNTLSSGSHGTDQWGNSTEPSSDESLFDKTQNVQRPDIAETYGFAGFGGAPQFQGPIFEEHNYDAPGYGEPGYGQRQTALPNGPYPRTTPTPMGMPHQNPLPTPMKQAPIPRPIKLGHGKANGAINDTSSSASYSKSEKRKSWIGKRFSRG